MPETIPQIRPSFNRSLRLETRPEWLSADTGALVQREMMDRSGLIDWLTERLHDPRHPSSIRYPLSDLLRTRLLLLGQGWRDQSDADRLRQDPSLRVASQTRRGTAALEEGHGLASQPTLSRLLDTLSREENVPVLHQAVTELACRRIEMIEGRRRKRGKKTMYLDVDGLPVEVHGHPPGSEWNGYYRQRMYHGLVASCAETGDLIDGEIFPGASYLGKKALDCGPRAGRATATTGAGDAVTSGRGVSSGEAAPCLGAWLRLGDIATTKPRVKAENHFMFTLELYYEGDYIRKCRKGCP